MTRRAFGVTTAVYCEAPISGGKIFSVCQDSQTATYLANSLGYAALNDANIIVTSIWDSPYVSIYSTEVVSSSSIRRAAVKSGSDCPSLQIGLCASLSTFLSATTTYFTIYAPEGNITTQVTEITDTVSSTITTTLMLETTDVLTLLVTETSTVTSVVVLLVTGTTNVTSISTLLVTNSTTFTSVSTIFVTDIAIISDIATVTDTATVTNTTTVTDTNVGTSTITNTLTINGTVTNTVINTVTISGERASCPGIETFTLTESVPLEEASILLTIYTEGDVPGTSTYLTCNPSLIWFWCVGLAEWLELVRALYDTTWCREGKCEHPGKLWA